MFVAEDGGPIVEGEQFVLKLLDEARVLNVSEEVLEVYELLLDSELHEVLPNVLLVHHVELLE
jgi:hypothetical protein